MFSCAGFELDLNKGGGGVAEAAHSGHVECGSAGSAADLVVLIVPEGRHVGEVIGTGLDCAHAGHRRLQVYAGLRGGDDGLHLEHLN